MRNTHELFLVLSGKTPSDTKIISTSMRFDPKDWTTFKLIRSLHEERVFGQVSKSAYVLVRNLDIILAEGFDLLVSEDAEAIPVFIKDPDMGTGWQPNRCFLSISEDE